MKAVSGQFDQAIEVFEQLKAGGGAKILSDLAAVRFARFDKTRNYLELVLALEEIDQAVELDPHFPEARFNLAVILDALGLPRQAAVAWNDYLGLDPDSPWTLEAQANLRSIQLRRLFRLPWHGEGDVLTQKSFQASRHEVERVLMSDWAKAEKKGDLESARQFLNRAEKIGDYVARAGGDRLMRDSVIAINRTRLGAVDRYRLDSLIRGHIEYGAGLALFDSDDIKAAQVHFEQSARHLTAGGSPFAYVASFRKGVCYHYSGQYELSIDLMDDLVKDPALKAYPSLRGQALWMNGLSYLKAGKLEESLSSYEASSRAFKESREPESEISVDVLIAENLRFQGLNLESWTYRQSALLQAYPYGLTRDIHNSLFDAAEHALQQGMIPTALYFQNEMILNDLRGQDYLSQSEAFTRRARTRSRVGRHREALSDLRRAWELLPRIAHDRREAQRAELNAASGEVYMQLDTPRAAGYLTSAIDFYKSDKRDFILPSLYFQRARALILLKRFSEAEVDLNHGIEEVESSRAELGEDERRAGYFERVRNIFDAMVGLQITQGRSDLAFRYSESLRAQSLLDGIQGRTVQVRRTSIQKIQISLHPDVCVVEYLVLGNKIFAWTITSKSFYFKLLSLNAAEVEGFAAELHESLASAEYNDRTSELLSRLHEVLISPLRAGIGDGRRIVVVPDRFLFSVPFSGLLDRERNKYLIEDHQVTMSPSAAVYVQSVKRRRESKEGLGRLLIVGASLVNKAEANNELELPGSRSELKTISRLAKGRMDSLEGRTATKANFVGMASRYEIIHIASHAIVNLVSPDRSALVLSPEDGGRGGLLEAREIRRLHLENTRLVALSSCDSAYGRLSSSEGAMSLSRSFLAAGASSVLGSLWPVEDRRTAVMLGYFYEVLLSGRSAGEALQATQIRSIRDGRQLGRQREEVDWAAFHLIGGETSGL